jgi:hypothetical protein
MGTFKNLLLITNYLSQFIPKVTEIGAKGPIRTIGTNDVIKSNLCLDKVFLEVFL